MKLRWDVNEYQLGTLDELNNLRKIKEYNVMHDWGKKYVRKMKIEEGCGCNREDVSWFAKSLNKIIWWLWKQPDEWQQRIFNLWNRFVQIIAVLNEWVV